MFYIAETAPGWYILKITPPPQHTHTQHNIHIPSTNSSIQRSIHPSIHQSINQYSNLLILTYINVFSKQTNPIHQMRFLFFRAQLCLYPSTGATTSEGLKYGVAIYMAVLKIALIKWKQVQNASISSWIKLDINTICLSRRWIDSHRNILSTGSNCTHGMRLWLTTPPIDKPIQLLDW